MAPAPSSLLIPGCRPPPQLIRGCHPHSPHCISCTAAASPHATCPKVSTSTPLVPAQNKSWTAQASLKKQIRFGSPGQLLGRKGCLRDLLAVIPIAIVMAVLVVVLVAVIRGVAVDQTPVHCCRRNYGCSNTCVQAHVKTPWLKQAHALNMPRHHANDGTGIRNCYRRHSSCWPLPHLVTHGSLLVVEDARMGI